MLDPKPLNLVGKAIVEAPSRGGYRGLGFCHNLNSLKGGDIGEVLQGLLRGIPGVKTRAHIA